MVDLHCHLLPGVDDGSKNMTISLRLAREATENGVTHALLTPHHMNERYVNHKQDVIRMTKEFQGELKAVSILILNQIYKDNMFKNKRSVDILEFQNLILVLRSIRRLIIN